MGNNPVTIQTMDPAHAFSECLYRRRLRLPVSSHPAVHGTPKQGGAAAPCGAQRTFHRGSRRTDGRDGGKKGRRVGGRHGGWDWRSSAALCCGAPRRSAPLRSLRAPGRAAVPGQLRAARGRERRWELLMRGDACPVPDGAAGDGYLQGQRPVQEVETHYGHI